jgi:hypothetical protein
MREYTVQGKNITVAGATTLVAINPPTGRAIEIIRAWCSQVANATSAQIAIELGLKASVFSTLTSATPEKLKPSDPVSYITGGTAGAAGTAGINASVEGAGTHTTKYPDSFNALQGWIWQPSYTLGETFILSSADALAFALKFSAAPTTLSGWNFGVTFREIG